MVPEPFQQVAAVCGVRWCPMVLLAVWQNTNWPRLTPILLRCHGRPHAPALRGCRSPRHSRVCELISQPIESCAYFKCSDYFFVAGWRQRKFQTLFRVTSARGRLQRFPGHGGDRSTACLCERTIPRLCLLSEPMLFRHKSVLSSTSLERPRVKT